MADRNGYIGRAPGDSSVVVARQTFSPTGIQTDFTFASGYVVGYLDLYLNGARLIEGQDFTATDGSVVGLTTYAQNGDVLELVAYKAFNATNVQSAGGDFSVGGNLTVVGYTTANTYYGDGSNLTGITAGYWEKTDAGINTSSSVGIGTTNPQAPLHLFGSDDILVKVESTDRFAHIELGDNSSIVRITNDGDTGSLRLRADKDNAVSDSNIQFEIDGTEKVRITSTGNVGIGTDNPTYLLDVKTTDDTTYTAGNFVNNPVARLHNQSFTTDSFASLVFRTGSGDSAIGFVYPGTVNQADFVICNDGGVNGVERLRITSAGDVGIGTATVAAESKVHILDTATDGYRPLVVEGTATNGSVIEYKNNGATRIRIGSAGGNNLSGSDATDGLIRSEANMLFAVGNSEKLRIGSSGQIGLGGANYGSTGQVLTSNGASSAPTWQDASGGDSLDVTASLFI